MALVAVHVAHMLNAGLFATGLSLSVAVLPRRQSGLHKDCHHDLSLTLRQKLYRSKQKSQFASRVTSVVPWSAAGAADAMVAASARMIAKIFILLEYLLLRDGILMGLK